MSDTVIRKTPKELHEQRARLIASTGLSEKVLRERGKAFQLYPEHQAVWDTVHGIDYLLDSTEPRESIPAELERLRAEVSELYTEIEAAQKGLSDMARKRNAEMDRADKAEAMVTRLQTGEQPALAHVGWYCWRCRGLVSRACRSDNVPVHVPVEWEKSMVAEIERKSEGDE